MQRALAGGAGSLLGFGGAGGLVYLHWPIVSPSSACVVAGGIGAVLLSYAARGELPAPKGTKKAGTPKRLLEVKLHNDEVRLASEIEELKKLQVQRMWPLPVQAALAEADGKAAKAKEATREEEAKALAARVKEELSAGATGDEVRQRLRPRLFVFDFNPQQSKPNSTKKELELLTQSISFILKVASRHDEVMLRLTSPGGAVSTYGLAASQLQRLRKHGLRLTVCVDAMAASGGYMMACVADHIVAAEFAMIGSIGVIAGAPNIHKILEKNDVEITQVTAGKYKRTLNVVTPNTEEGLAKFTEDINTIHDAFKAHIQRWRPALDVEAVATGEVWLASDALQRGLIDEVGVSNAFVGSREEDGFDIVELAPAKVKKEGFAKFAEKFGGGGGDAVESLFGRVAAVVQGAVQRGGTLEPRLEAPQLRAGGE